MPRVNPHLVMPGSTASLQAVLSRAAAAFLARTALTGTGRGGQSSGSLGSNILSAEAHCPLLQTPPDPGSSFVLSATSSTSRKRRSEAKFTGTLNQQRSGFYWCSFTGIPSKSGKLLGVAASGRRLERR